MLDPIIAAATVFLMTLVGTGITIAELTTALRRPRLIAAVTIGQVALLPVMALAAGWLIGADATMAIGLLLIGTAPGGALSNVYTYVLGADVALSVALTAASTLAAVITMPLMLDLSIRYGLGSDVVMAVPGGRIATQLLATLVLPVLVGMLLRRRREEFFVLYRRQLRTAGLAVIVGVVLLVLAVNAGPLSERWSELLGASVVYTLLAAAAGAAFAAAVRTTTGSRVAIAIEFTCRNSPAALLVASLALGRDDLAVFAAVLLIIQSPVLLGLANRLAPGGQRDER